MYTGRSCWLCGRNGTAEPLDKHHIFGGAYRKKSEKYGLTVYLCHGSCHIFGEKAVHSCRETMDELHRYGQKMAMERMGWTKEDFMREFGRNYNEEGKLLGMPVNRLATDMAYLFNDVIAGNAILIGTTDEDFIGLTKEAAENIVEKWG